MDHGEENENEEMITQFRHLLSFQINKGNASNKNPKLDIRDRNNPVQFVWL